MVTESELTCMCSVQAPCRTLTILSQIAIVTVFLHIHYYQSLIFHTYMYLYSNLALLLHRGHVRHSTELCIRMPVITEVHITINRLIATSKFGKDQLIVPICRFAVNLQ